MSELVASIEIKGIDKLTPVLRSIQSQFGSTTSRMISENRRLSGSFNALKAQVSGLTSIARKFGVVAGSIFGISVGSGFVGAIKLGAEFQTSLADLSAITGVTGNKLDILKNKALELSKASVRSAPEVLEAFKLVGSAKSELFQDLDQFSEVTKNVLLLANANKVDLKTAADVAVTALNQFGVGADQANRFVNVLAAGVQLGASELVDIGEALKYSGVQAAQTHLSFEQTNAALQILGQNGIKGSMAGTSFRTVLLRLSTQANKNFNPAMVGLGKALDNLAKAHLSTAQRAKLFGQESLTTADILINNRKTVDEWTTSFTGTKIAQEQAAIQLNTFQKRSEALANSIKNILIVAFGRIEPKLRPLIDHMRQLAESFDAGGFSEKVVSIIDTVSGLIKSFGGLDGIIRLVKEGLIFIAALKMTSFFTGLAGEVGLVMGNFLGLTGAIAGATGSLQTFGIVYTGIQSFSKTFHFLRNLEKEYPESKKYIKALGNIVVPGLSGFESVQQFSKFILSDRIAKVDEIRGYKQTVDRHYGEGQFTPVDESDLRQVQNFSPVINSDGSGLQSRLTSLTQEIATQQSTLKKPQKIEMNINISSPVPTQVTGIKGGENTSITASTGKMVN